MSTKQTINSQQIKDWKAAHGRIYKTAIGDPDNGGLVLIWRKLKRQEYLELMSIDQDGMTEEEKVFKRQDKITELVTLYPENIKELVQQNAGLSMTLTDEVLAKSGFDIPETEEL